MNDLLGCILVDFVIDYSVLWFTLCNAISWPLVGKSIVNFLFMLSDRIMEFCSFIDD
jgi:hypothetical protein